MTSQPDLCVVVPLVLLMGAGLAVFAAGVGWFLFDWWADLWNLKKRIGSAGPDPQEEETSP